MSDSLRLVRFPLIGHAEASRWQAETASAVRDGGAETLALLQHTPVYTLGRNARRDNLLVDVETLQARGAGVVDADRGGDVTFHGPGQLVAYPILNLRNRGIGAVDYVRRLEAVVIETLSRFGLRGERVAGRPGVWVCGAEALGAAAVQGGRRSSKVAAIGVRISGGVSTHGLALNIDPDLAWFDAIVPCGLADASVTSMARELGYAPTIAAVEAAMIDAFARVFGVAIAYDETSVGAVRERPLHAPRPLATPRRVVAHGG
ncbi:MAG TPA: lipoyl(octanoyl) transferase LipB [Dehalococcoidia bacterium]|nr:lipoyl(octanoyl) transferase LipB [Dehalococcoidia bacterium]